MSNQPICLASNDVHEHTDTWTDSNVFVKPNFWCLGVLKGIFR